MHTIKLRTNTRCNKAKNHNSPQPNKTNVISNQSINQSIKADSYSAMCCKQISSGWNWL